MERTEMEATHFIEQYNATDEFKTNDSRLDVFHHPCMPIDYLQEVLAHTRKCEKTMKTVAIFYIKPKKS